MPLAYCHALPSRNASGHLCINFLPSPRIRIHFGLSDRHRHQADHSESTWSGSLALLAPCAVAYVWLSEEAQSARGASGWKGSQPLAVKGCGSLRISAWPAGMGSVSSALARSRNTVVQPRPSPPQPEVPLAARKDSKTQRLGLRFQDSSGPPAAWERPAARPSPEAPLKLEGAELSPVLKSLPTMSQSSSSAGEFPRIAPSWRPQRVCASFCLRGQ